MTTEAKLKTLQMVYAGALADATLRYGRQGVLASVEAEKRAEQLASGSMRAAQMGIKEPEEAFIKLRELFGCADWQIEKEDSRGFSAEANQCMLSGIAKKIGAPSPCRIFCLDPIEGMIKGLDPDYTFKVKSTCYGEGRCLVEVR